MTGKQLGDIGTRVNASVPWCETDRRPRPLRRQNCVVVAIKDHHLWLKVERARDRYVLAPLSDIRELDHE